MQSSKIRIIFLGTPDFVQPIRKELEKHFTLVDTLDDSDLAIVAAYGRILTYEDLNKPKYGCINIHPSLLPKYRGPSPIQSAILNGDTNIGISIIKMDEKVDHGPIIYQQEVDILKNETFEDLAKRLFEKSAKILPKIIEDFIDGKIKLYEQNHQEATLCEKLTRDSGYFNIENPPSNELLNIMIRAYYPWPGVWTKWKDKIVKFLPNNTVQMEGKKPVNFKDFLNGYPDFPIKHI